MVQNYSAILITLNNDDHKDHKGEEKDHNENERSHSCLSLLLAKNTKLGSFELPTMVLVVVFLLVTIVIHLDDDYIKVEGEKMKERKKGKIYNKKG